MTNNTVESCYDNQWCSSKNREEYDLILAMLHHAIEFSYTKLGDLENKQILDLGCGYGTQSLFFSSKRAHVTAIDISEKCLKHIQTETITKKLKISTKKCDAEKLPFLSESFDLIYINSLLMHVDANVVLETCAHLLKKKGKVIIIKPLKAHPLIKK